MNKKEEHLPGRIRWDDQKADLTLPSSSIVIPSWMVNENRGETIGSECVVMILIFISILNETKRCI